MLSGIGADHHACAGGLFGLLLHGCCTGDRWPDHGEFGPVGGVAEDAHQDVSGGDAHPDANGKRPLALALAGVASRVTDART